MARRVAIVGVVLRRTRPEKLHQAVADAIVGGCFAALAYRGYAENVALVEAGGAMPDRWHRAALALASAGIAVLIIGSSDLAFLAGYYGFLRLAYQTVVMSHWMPYGDPGFLGMAAVIGVIPGAAGRVVLERGPVAAQWAEPPRRQLKRWPFALVACGR